VRHRFTEPEDAGLLHAMRAWSVESSFYLHAVGEALGMGGTDVACLSLLLLEGPLGAGVLAERSGLTSGAVTGLVDRLERAGWVRRTADPADRRRVIVEAVAERADELHRLLAPMLAAATSLRAELSDAERSAVERYAQASAAMLGREVARLRSGRHDKAAARSGWVTVVPRARSVGGHAGLIVGGAASDVQVRVGALPGALCSLEFPVGRPSVSVRGSQVVVTARTGRWYEGGAKGTVILADELSWTVEFRGAASRYRAELGGLHLRGLAVRGGACVVDVALPVPDGPVALRVEGGATTLRLTRPRGVPVRAATRGGCGRVTLDGRLLSAADRASGSDRGPLRRAEEGVYELEVRGGACEVTVGVG
jgi:DNA-binding MarR family transcriptional regulator